MPSAARALQRDAAPRSELSASVCKRLSACRRTRKPPACRDAHDAAVCGIQLYINTEIILRKKLSKGSHKLNNLHT